MLDAVGQGSQTAPTDSSPTNPSRKRSREFFDALSQLITKNVNKKPVRLPKRQPTESDLLAQYHASRVSQQQPSQRSSAAFQYIPARKPAPAPALFSPATIKMYASPPPGNAGPGASPSIPLASLPTQQQGFFGTGLAHSVNTTPVHNRVNPPLSRLGPSTTMAQPTTPLRPMQYLNSAPAVGPSPAVASPHPTASSNFTPKLTPHQTEPLYGYDGGSLTSNTSPHDAHPDFGLGMNGDSSQDQRQNVPPSPGFDRMYGQRGFNGRQPEGFQNGFQNSGVAEQACSSQQAAAKAPTASPAPPVSQLVKVSSAKQEAVKRLITKNAALSRFASPAPSRQSPFQAAGLQPKAVVGSVLKRKASQALAEETWHKASRQRMENALSGISKAEEAVKQEPAATTTPSRPRPPTAVLGFAPPSPFCPTTKPTTGKYSWPANFFDDSKQEKVCKAADSEQESAAAGQHQDELVDTGAVSSYMGNGDSVAGDGQEKDGQEKDGQEKDFGAAWRDAAQSPPPHQSPAPAAHNEDIPQVTSPPFATAQPPQQQQQQQQPMASTNLPDLASPSQTPSATPSRAPPTAFARMFGTPQHTPAAPPLASMFAYAASPATVPVKSRREGSSSDHRQATGNPMPAMFSAAISTASAAAGSSDAASDCAPIGTGTDAAAPSMRGAGLLPHNQAAAVAKAADSAAVEALRERAAASKPVEAVMANGWGAALLASNQAAAAKATEAVAEAAKAQENSSNPVANGWGAALLASNQAAAAKATEAVAKAQEASSKPVANGWGAALLASNQAAAAKATEAVVEAAKASETPSKPATNGWDTALLASNQAAAAKATEAVAKAQEASTKPAANGWGVALLASNQAAAAKATEAVAEAAKASKTTSEPVANGWGAALLVSNQAAATRATEAVAGAAKADETQAGPFTAAGFTSQATAAAANTPAAAAAASAPMQIQFGVPPAAQAGWGSTAGTEANMPAVPVMSGPFQFGVIPAGAMAQTASPPLAIPAAQVTAATPDGDNSLGRDGSWMSISPETCDFQQPAPAGPVVPQPQQGNHVFGPALTNGLPPFGAQPAAGLFGGWAGQSQVGPAQLSAFPGPSSSFTLGAAGNDSRPTSARNKRLVLKGGKRRAR